jgi:hypothetical protein
MNPIVQVAYTSRRFGKYRSPYTVRENEVNNAIFSLRYAIDGDDLTCRQLAGVVPSTWEEFVQTFGGRRKRHHRWSVVAYYPFLSESYDPWGNRWVYRYVIDDRDPDTIWYTFVIGSVGPDGVECCGEFDASGHYRRPPECRGETKEADDLVGVVGVCCKKPK